MCSLKDEKKPNLLWSVLSNKCPQCRRGRLFSNNNPYRLKTMMKMPKQCPVCGQKTELEEGFYFGTGYVSYGLAVAFTGMFFVFWWLTLGISIYDNSIFWWLGFNTSLLLVLQPVLQRLSRSIWIAFFVPYNKFYQSGITESVS